MRLTPAQSDRALGAVLTSAVGDALGAGYEFDAVRPGPEGPRMVGGGLGGFAPGEWTDDTSMAWCVLDAAAAGADLRSSEGLTEVARRFRAWAASGPADIGIQTSAVLRGRPEDVTGEQLTAAAADLHRRTGRTAGNGSLMRTVGVSLRHLDDAQACAEAARAVSDLTHADPLAGDACVIWSLAIRHAILTGELDIRVGLGHLVAPAADWEALIAEAETAAPGTFTGNGYVVVALQASWAAIAQTPVPPDAPWRHVEDALATAIGIGHDTDTVAAIAGALLGARWGASAVPSRWRRILHGYPGLTGSDLMVLASLAAGSPKGRWPDLPSMPYDGWPGGVAVRHPHDDGVWLGSVDALRRLPKGVDAVVSLCRVGRSEVPEGVELVSFWLIDEAGASANPHLDFVLRDAAETVADLRDEGRTVLLHCVAAQSRTPTVAAVYGMLRGTPGGQAMREVCDALPSARPNPGFREAVRRLEGVVGTRA